MKTDPLRQFVALRSQLLREKETLERRLAEINAALGSLTVPPANPPSTAPAPAPAPAAAMPTRAIARKAKAPKEAAAAAHRPAAPARTKPAAQPDQAHPGLSLREAVLAAVRQKPLDRHEILKAVTALGYHFRAKNPLNSLSAFLYMDKSVKNVGGRFSPA
jgi:hypothetical protein